MSDTSATDPPAEILARLRDAGRLLILTHTHPDGDAVGSAEALARAARAAGKEAVFLLAEEVPPLYAFLLEGDPPAGETDLGREAEEADAVVVVDTSARQQLRPFEKTLDRCGSKTVVIDHHATGGDVEGTCWVDPTAAATGILVVEAIEALGWPLDERTARTLLVAVLTDTGWLRFSNTDGRCLRAAADLVDRGAAPAALYERLYQQDRPERLRLLHRALGRLTFHAGDRLAVMSLRSVDFAETGARRDETENLINEALRVGSVEVVAMLVETSEQIRVSLRSRREVDVSALAAALGGGGHARAAGCRLETSLDEAIETVTKACLTALI